MVHITGWRFGAVNYKAPTWRLWGEEKCEGAIYTVYLKKVRYHHPSRSITQESDDDEISHLEWETVRVRFLKAGTLEKLIESLSSDTGELESTFVNVFLATYRTFASTRQVLNLILDRYLALNSTSNKVNVPEVIREDHKKSLKTNPTSMAGCIPRRFPRPSHVFGSSAAEGVHEGKSSRFRLTHQSGLQTRQDEKRRKYQRFTDDGANVIV